MEAVFVGTGVSTGVPVMGHLRASCACREAMSNPNSRNRRNNVSLLLRPATPPTAPPDVAPLLAPDFLSEGYNTSDTVRRKKAMSLYQPAVLIDCGKTFRDAYFRVLAPLGVEALSSLLLTHDHADAMMGIDDLRDLQSLSFTEATGEVKCHYYLPCYATRRTLDSMRSLVGYIHRASVDCGEAPPSVAEAEAQRAAAHAVPIPSSERRITCLDFLTLSDATPSPFGIIGLPEVEAWSFPVEHGPNYISLGFAFRTPARGLLVYVSDVSAVPEATHAFVRSLGHIDVLVVDMLLGPGTSHNCHFCVDDVMALAERWQPHTVLGVGMYCELEHETTCAMLDALLKDSQAKGKCVGVSSIAPAYDGMKFSIP